MKDAGFDRVDASSAKDGDTGKAARCEHSLSAAAFHSNLFTHSRRGLDCNGQ